MATQATAQIYITNKTDGNATILLWHNNSSNGTQRGSWTAAPKQTVGPLTVQFETGLGTGGIQDYWSVLLDVKDGSTPGQYVNHGGIGDPYWKECQLQHGDSGQSITLTVDTSTFNVALKSGGCKDSMQKFAPSSKLTHVFVVMLENHSFDNIFAMSGIPGITAATTSNYNSYNDTRYQVSSGAPVSMPTDPGHEFLDVLEQLAGAGAQYPSGGPYPTIGNSGFASNYATSVTEGTGLPSADEIGDVMAAFATPSQLPVIYQLATTFAVCDHWYASMPGPTWPNRFFVHGASSAGLDDSPSSEQIGVWESVKGFTYSNGSIYDALGKAGISYKFYNDTNSVELSNYSDDPQNGSPVGAIPQVAALHGVSLGDIYSLSHFASDLQGPYPFAYTFIEPHYGSVVNGTYAGGSSQHPMDDVFGGEALLKAVYEAIRNSPYWETSLLIITYDEHGGFYDSVAPPAAKDPGDTWPDPKLNTHGFNFKQYGVRVPAVVVSPLIPAATVDHTVYDHSSVLATVEHFFNVPPLTKRDAAASNVKSLLSLGSPRTDCPTTLANPAPSAKPKLAQAATRTQLQDDQRPLPKSGNLYGTLYIAHKTERELGGQASKSLADIETVGQARDYVQSVLDKVRAEQAKRPKVPRRT